MTDETPTVEPFSPQHIGWKHPTGKWPTKVAILGLGPSMATYLQEGLSNSELPRNPDEVWTVNMGARRLQHDLAFCMHDMRNSMVRNPAEYNFYKSYKRPFITCYEIPDFKGSIAYPIEAILRKFGFFWFSNGIAYIIAYAIWVGVKELYLYGLDYDHPNTGNATEPGKDVCTAWTVLAMGMGITVTICPDSSLMNQRDNPFVKYYGYTDPHPYLIQQQIEKENQQAAQAQAGVVPEGVQETTARVTL